MSKFSLLFLFVFFGGVGTALFSNGAAAFIVYELVYFLNPGNRWWSAGIPDLRYSFIIVIVMMIVLAKDYQNLSKLSPWSEQNVFKWMVALLLMYYFAYTFALHIPMHSKFTFEFTKLIIIILLAYKLINTPAMLKACLWAYITGCAYIGYLATGKGRNSSGRVEGIGMVDAPDANDTAAVLVPAAVMLMYFAWQGSMRARFMAALFGVFIANGLVLINSRGSFLGVVLSLGLFLLYMIFSSHQKKGQKKVALLMIVVGLSGAFYMTDDVFWERMSTLKSSEEQEIGEEKEDDGSGRILFWFKTFDMLEEYPFGMGVYGYNMLAPHYMTDEERGGVKYRSVHSMWFQGLGEVGWLGIGVFLCMLISLALSTRRAKKFTASKCQYDIYFLILALECALIGYLVAGTFINRFRAEVLYWMILFLAIAVKVYYLRASGSDLGIKSVKSNYRKR